MPSAANKQPAEVQTQEGHLDQAALDDIEFAWDIDTDNFFQGDPLAGSDVDNVLVVFRVLFVAPNTLISYQPATGLRGCLEKPDGPGMSTELPEPFWEDDGAAGLPTDATSSQTMRPWQFQMLGLLPDGSAPKKVPKASS